MNQQQRNYACHRLHRITADAIDKFGRNHDNRNEIWKLEEAHRIEIEKCWRLKSAKAVHSIVKEFLSACPSRCTIPVIELKILKETAESKRLEREIKAQQKKNEDYKVVVDKIRAAQQKAEDEIMLGDALSAIDKFEKLVGELVKP